MHACTSVPRESREPKGILFSFLFFFLFLLLACFSLSCTLLSAVWFSVPHHAFPSVCSSASFSAIVLTLSASAVFSIFINRVHFLNSRGNPAVLHRWSATVRSTWAFCSSSTDRLLSSSCCSCQSCCAPSAWAGLHTGSSRSVSCSVSVLTPSSAFSSSVCQLLLLE